MMAWKRTGQTSAEYAVLVACIIAACIVMQIYMKRGVSGKIRESTDRIGEQFTPHTATYSLGKTFIGGRTNVTTAQGADTTTHNDETQGRTGSENTTGTSMATETLFAP